MKGFFLILGLILLCVQASGCREVSAASGDHSAERTPRTFVFIVDISASRTQVAVAQDRSFLDDIAQKLSFGDQVVLMQMQQEGLSDQPLHWSVAMPSPRDSTFITVQDRGRLSGAVQSVRSAIPRFFKADGKISHTDIFTTLLAANDLARSGGDKPKTLVLLSDMLQSTREFEMTGMARMPKLGWIESQKRNGLLPQLNGACVVVVGANTTTREGVGVRDFWARYFSAAGARLDPRDYHIYPPSSDQPLCH